MLNSVRNRLLDAINVAFDAVGADTLTKMPKPKVRDNRLGIAWEYFVSTHLVARANARLDAAKKAAIEAGVIFDHYKHPRAPGTNEPIYSGEHVIVWLNVRNGSTLVNADKMSEYLLEHKVDAKLVSAAYAHATNRGKPVHTFKASLVAGVEPNGK